MMFRIRINIEKIIIMKQMQGYIIPHGYMVFISAARTAKILSFSVKPQCSIISLLWSSCGTLVL